MKKLFVLCALALFGCDHGGVNNFSRSEEITTFSYTKDARTGLCFITSPVSVDLFTYRVYSNVPCTPEVEKLIETK